MPGSNITSSLAAKLLMGALTVAVGITVVTVLERPQRKLVPVEPHSELAAADFSGKSGPPEDLSRHVSDAESPIVATAQGSGAPILIEPGHQRSLKSDDVIVVMLAEVPIEISASDFTGAWTQSGSAAGGAAPVSSSPDVDALASVANTSDGSNSGSGSHGSSNSNFKPLAKSAGSQFSGDVLIIGGARAHRSVSTVQVFDTTANTVIKTGKLTVARSAMAAAALGNGEVLVTGGDGRSGDTLSSAETYSPATAEFSLTSQSMSTGRSHHTATVIQGCNCPVEGEVLVAGGFSANDDTAPVNSAELYDPNSGTFTATGSMTIERANHSATAITSGPLAGKVLIVGGQNALGLALIQAELYDPITGKFTATASLSVARKNQGAVYLDPAVVKGPSAGEVLIVGGEDSNGALASVELFDSSTNAFNTANAMTAPRTLLTTTLLNSGEVLNAGGENAGQPINSAEIFDTQSGLSQMIAPMASVHDAGTATILEDGRVLIVGGHSAVAEYFDPDNATFSPAGELSVPLTEAGAVLIR